MLAGTWITEKGRTSQRAINVISRSDDAAARDALQYFFARQMIFVETMQTQPPDATVRRGVGHRQLSNAFAIPAQKSLQ